MEYINNTTIAAIKSDSILQSFLNDDNYNQNHDFPDKLFLVTSLYKYIWTNVKRYFIGSSNTIKLLTSKEPTKLLPTQFQKHFFDDDKKNIVVLNESFSIGIQSEVNVMTIVNNSNFFPLVRGHRHQKQYMLKPCGKICIKECFPISSTPDYVIWNNGIKPSRENKPACRIRQLNEYVCGVGECKTSISKLSYKDEMIKLKESKNINDLLQLKPVNIRNAFFEYKTKMKKTIYEKESDIFENNVLLKMLETLLSSSKWYVCTDGYSFGEVSDTKGMIINLISNDIGKQVLSEAMVLGNYIVKEDNIKCILILPTYNRDGHDTSFILINEFEIPYDVLQYFKSLIIEKLGSLI